VLIILILTSYPNHLFGCIVATRQYNLNLKIFLENDFKPTKLHPVWREIVATVMATSKMLVAINDSQNNNFIKI